MQATNWFDQQMAKGFPDMQRGAIFVSMYHGSWISRLIAKLGKSPNGNEIPNWSHVGIYLGMGHIAEATHPRGGVRSMRRYMGSGFTFGLYNIPNLTDMQRSAIASEAARLSNSPYDYAKIIRHLIDNVIERFTWRTMKQKGIRPLALLFRLDKDADAKNICSELVERSVKFGTGIKIVDGREIGNARPTDVWEWLRKSQNARATIFHVKGDVRVEAL